jgi:hypothetical protein
MASAADIRRGRIAAANDIRDGKALCTDVSSVESKNMHGFRVSLYYDSISSGETSKLVKGIDKGFELLGAAGHAGVVDEPIHLYLTDKAGVMNVAFVGDAAGGQTVTIFLGPRVHHAQRKMKNPPMQIEGGITAGGRARGIADQEYDGTTVWFGNPKQVAMITAVTVHEMGHVLHEYNNPGIFWDLKVDRTAQQHNATGWMAHAMDVSQYATNNALEFVAETFTGTILGKNYAGPLMGAYAALGGP